MNLRYNEQTQYMKDSSPRSMVRRMSNTLQRPPNTFNIVKIVDNTIYWEPLEPQQGEWTIYVRFMNGPTCEYKINPEQTIQDLQQYIQHQALPHLNLRYQGQLLKEGTIQSLLNNKAIINGGILP